MVDWVWELECKLFEVGLSNFLDFADSVPQEKTTIERQYPLVIVVKRLRLPIFQSSEFAICYRHWRSDWGKVLYSVRGLEQSELGGSHGCPGQHRAYYRSDRPVIKIGPKGALGSHEIRPIHSTPSLGQSIPSYLGFVFRFLNTYLLINSLVTSSMGWMNFLTVWSCRQGFCTLLRNCLQGSPCLEFQKNNTILKFAVKTSYRNWNAIPILKNASVIGLTRWLVNCQLKFQNGITAL